MSEARNLGDGQALGARGADALRESPLAACAKVGGRRGIPGHSEPNALASPV